jgi:hypothetical protein
MLDITVYGIFPDENSDCPPENRRIFKPISANDSEAEALGAYPSKQCMKASIAEVERDVNRRRHVKIVNISMVIDPTGYVFLADLKHYSLQTDYTTTRGYYREGELLESYLPSLNDAIKAQYFAELSDTSADNDEETE